MIRFTATAALSTLLLAAAGAAVAQESKVKVPYSDLNLASAAGVSTLDGRLVLASRTVCGPNTGPLDAGRHHARARCRSAALKDARGKAKTVVAQITSQDRLASAN